MRHFEGASHQTPLTSTYSSENCADHCKHNYKPTTVKCIVIGDSKIGKTSLVVSYTTNGYPTEYRPSALDTYCVDVCADARPVHLQICDAGGKTEVSSLRHLSYPDTHVILLCFSVVQPESFRSLRTKWLNELAEAPILLNPLVSLAVSQLNNKQSSCNNLPLVQLNNVPSIKPKTMCSPRSKKNQSVEMRSIPGPAFLLIGCACDLRNDIKHLLELSKLGEKPVDKKTAEMLAAELGAEAYVECSALTQKNLKKVFDLTIWYGLRVADAGGPAPRLSLINGICCKNDDCSISSSTSLVNNFVKSFKKRPGLRDQPSNEMQKYEKRGWRKLLCMS